MDTKVLPTPVLSRTKLLGQPYHGPITGLTLRLPNGTDRALKNAGNFHGDCYQFEVPGVPVVGLTPTEVAAETALGREWRHYALLSGRSRNYGEIRVGADAWLYADANGDVWRIACAQLDTDFLSVSIPLDGSAPPTHFPSTADLAFTVQRFGLIDPDQPVAEVRTINKTAVDLGGAFECDPIFWPGTTAFYDYMRSYPHQGTTRQWMPIAIDDVNKSGSHALLCVNRTAEQGMWSLPAGRGLPKSWIEVSVSGSGLEGIALSLAVVRVNGVIPDDVTVSDTTVSTQATRPWGIGLVDQDFVETPPDREPSLSDSYTSTDVTARVGAVNHTTHHGLYAGGYYDSNDVLQWVWAGDAVQVATCSGAGSLSESTTYDVYAHERKVYTNPDRTTQLFDLRACVNINWSATLSSYETIANQVLMGGHAVNFLLEIDRSASSSGHSNFAFGGSSDWTYDATTQHCSITGGAFGPYNWTGSDAPPLPIAAWVDLNNHSAVNVIGAEGQMYGWWYNGVLYGAPMLREFDGLVVVRVTNKVYAVIALGSVLQHGSSSAPPFPVGQRVVAIGTPDGWITGDSLALHSFASYQPATGELSHNSTPVGWL